MRVWISFCLALTMLLQLSLATAAGVCMTGKSDTLGHVPHACISQGSSSDGTSAQAAQLDSDCVQCHAACSWVPSAPSSLDYSRPAAAITLSAAPKPGLLLIALPEKPQWISAS